MPLHASAGWLHRKTAKSSRRGPLGSLSMRLQTTELVQRELCKFIIAEARTGEQDTYECAYSVGGSSSTLVVIVSFGSRPAFVNKVLISRRKTPRIALFPHAKCHHAPDVP